MTRLSSDGTVPVISGWKNSLRTTRLKSSKLPMNYRCPPEIVALANNLIRHNFLRTANKRPLGAYRPSPGGDIIRLLPSFLDEESEATGIVADIAQRYGLKPDGVVVLARTRKLLNHIESALRADRIAVVMPQRKSDFESTPFQWLHSILRLANDRQSRSNLDAVSGSFAQLTGVEVEPDKVVPELRPRTVTFYNNGLNWREKMLVSQRRWRCSIRPLIIWARVGTTKDSAILR
jgi:DNA helicase-2/ATP-dependent DNA helicase PcrA